MAIGRKPKSTHLHIVDGTKPTHERVLRETAGLLGDPPPRFTPEQRIVWDEFVSEIPLGILTSADRKTVELAVDRLIAYRDAQKMSVQMGLLVRHGPNEVRRNPAMIVAQRESEILLRLLTELGMTPASRARLEQVPDGKAQDPVKASYLR